ncbi:hypothetical protein AA15973_2110 [Komagataeibacter sucrofermentans DSM 15973]|nr:hypothetical protein AA15973_2110 [Komagataeibacter sucrofermentans DSM 15973]
MVLVFLPSHQHDTKGTKNMFIENISTMIAHSVDAMSSLTMVAFLPMIAALMIATIVSDRAA